MVYIFLLIIGIIIGVILAHMRLSWFCKKKYKELNQLTLNIDNYHQHLLELQNIEKQTKDNLLEIQKEQKNLQTKREEYSLQLDKLINNISVKREQQLKLEQNIENIINNQKKQIEEGKLEAAQEYLSMLTDLKNEFVINNKKLLQEQENIHQALKREKSIYDSIVKIKKEEMAQNDTVNYHTLVISNDAQEEIKTLNEIANKLSTPSVLYKAIYKIYYENPTNELIGRIVGQGRHIGIYKITNIQNGRCYIGQSNDLAARFKQHIKRGCGAEVPTKSKLYPAMLSEGLWNFTFEVIEECTEKELNEREDYYQNFYDAINFGYSIK